MCFISGIKQNRVGLVEVLLGILDWRAGGRHGICTQMKWNESEASIGRVLAVEVGVSFPEKSLKSCFLMNNYRSTLNA